MTKHKFIWAGLAIGVPALVLALWKGWWCKVLKKWQSCWRFFVC